MEWNGTGASLARGETACFECNPKPVPKSHPICTLRDTPDKPIHCIVYATDLLFPRLFSVRGVR
jgi:ubiquitin-like 1-activating enzyme E1 B